MTSIKRRLSLWLLGGLAVLWFAAGAGVYLSVRHSLHKSLDAALAVDARLARFTTRGDTSDDDSAPRGRGPRLQDRLADYHDPQGGSYFQTWNSNGEVIERSSSLGEMELPALEVSGTDPVFTSGKLADGRPVRMMAFRIAASPAKGPGKAKGKGRPGSESHLILLAKDSSAAEQTLTSVLGGIGITGLLAACGTIFLVSIALRHGLRPLQTLGEQSRTIDAPSLHARFDAASAPAELRPIYTALNELLHRLEQGFERERRFSADLAHEMRTPVAELKMLGEVAVKWPDQADPALPAHTLAIATQLEHLIEALLTLARLESGETTLQIAPVDLIALCTDCLRPHTAIAEEKHLHIHIDSPDSLSIDTDPRLLRIILSNLVSNAVEYSPARSSIDIALDAQHITIANQAPQLSPDDLPVLFDRFWRDDKSRGTTSHSGLGLPLARQAAQAIQCHLDATLSDGVLRFTLKKV
jgi:two-component system sensor histidine kinase QseC